MPQKRTIQRARRAKIGGKSVSTQAGEFVREQMEKMRRGGKRAAKNTRQAIAIGLSEARRAGVKLGAPKNKPKKIRSKAQQELRRRGR